MNKKKQPWALQNRRTLFEHPRITLTEDTVLLPSGQETTWLRFENLRDFVTVICVDNQERVLLVRQYNHPPGRMVHEFPGGVIDAGESPEQAASRELVEEVGLYPLGLEPLGDYLPNPRRTAMRCHVFLARDFERRPAKPEPEEFIMTRWLGVTELDSLIRAGDIENSNLLAAWLLFRLRSANT